MGFIGAFLIVFQSLGKNGVGGIQGNLLVLLATIFFVTYAITSAKKQAEKIVSPYSLIFYSSILAMIISFYPMLESVQKVNLGIRQIFALGWLGVISTVVFFVIFQYIVKKEGALVASVYAYLQATLGAIIGVVVLGEKMTIYIIIGAVLTFIGSKITTMKVAEKKEEEKPKRVLKKKVVRKVKSQELSKEEISKSENEKSSSKTEDLKPVKNKIEKIKKVENNEENKK
jgi:drug/metabolite transporter (DMT)-like permease